MNESMNTKLSQLELSVKAKNSLSYSGVITLGDLLEIPLDLIKKMPNIGKVTFGEIKNFLDKYKHIDNFKTESGTYEKFEMYNGFIFKTCLLISEKFDICETIYVQRFDLSEVAEIAYNDNCRICIEFSKLRNDDNILFVFDFFDDDSDDINTRVYNLFIKIVEHWKNFTQKKETTNE